MINLSNFQREVINKNSKFIKDDDWKNFIISVFHDGDDIEEEDFRNIFQFIYFDCDVDFLKNIDYIPPFMFMGADIRNLDFLNNYTNIRSIEDFAFSSSTLEVANIPDFIQNVECQAFSWCDNLKKVYLPKSLRSISPDAFEHTLNIEDCYVPNNIVSKIRGKNRLLNILEKSIDDIECHFI